MELIEVLLKIVMPIGIAIFLYTQKRSIRALISDFRVERTQSKTITEDELIEKMKIIVRHRHVGP